MFVRVKRIKGKPYAYLVENEWTPWGSRQKVTKYLGKTIKLTRFSESLTELPKGLQQTILEAIAQELKNHGFTREDHLLKQEDITVDLKEKTITQKTKRITLEMNEGYLCEHTLNELLAFAPEERPDESAKKLANLVLEAGLKLTEEQFVHLFEQAK
ncbi:hypothetical protein KY309_02355 [Candidatus Woesearchaeota archaeon]|nr:hypothetical protein [Candidatus Woesearchaeota archaeon]MBW3016429.1 hypothetical protein [Candidatus Woesearchaeota archaeon]